MIMINLSFERFADLVVVVYPWLIFLSLLFNSTNGTITNEIMHVTCGTNVELTCPIRSTKKSDEVISWFHPNTTHHRLSFITIGDILLPEYAMIGRFNLISSPSSIPRLSINNLLMEDQGYYNCKSSSNGQHSIKLIVHPSPSLTPSSPILLYPVNRTFSITCSFLCEPLIDHAKILWLVNGDILHVDRQQFRIETMNSNTQRLTVFLNHRNQHFTSANYTCRYDDKEASIFVRRRTKEELHRLPRQEGSSSAHLLQTVYGAANKSWYSSYRSVLMIFVLLEMFIRAM